MLTRNSIAGAILAGGKAARMEYTDKSLLLLVNQPLIEYTIELAAPQVSELLICANHNQARYSYLYLPIIADRINPYGGPLVGIYSALCWLADNRRDRPFSHLACFPGDVPVFPRNLVEKLAVAIDQTGAQVAICKSDEQLQPLFSLWSTTTQDILEKAILENLCGPKLILPRLNSVEVQFADLSARDFLNINTPEDLSAMERLFAANN